jgi:ubiquinone/menaquinone biosynthesis C-methylase UbiE
VSAPRGVPPGPDAELRVKEANRSLYDAVAGQYEAIDGRRSPRLEAWLRGTLADLRARAPGGRLVDLGAGSGLVTRCAKGVFEHRIGVDISAKIMEANRENFDEIIVSDVDRLPLADGSVDAVTCFAVLHHMYGFDRLAAEAARVLRPGGLFYSDHDMDAAFHRRFRPLLAIYRWMRNARAAYRKNGVTDEMYASAEYRQDGIDAEAVRGLLAEAGFSVEVSFHWYGLSPLTDRLFGARPRRRGWAPLAAIFAVRK